MRRQALSKLHYTIPFSVTDVYIENVRDDLTQEVDVKQFETRTIILRGPKSFLHFFIVGNEW
jgi:hypothetical protein